MGSLQADHVRELMAVFVSARSRPGVPAALALLTSYVTARSAARIDPLEALRAE